MSFFSYFHRCLGRSKKKDKCKNTQMYPLSETQYCPCDKYNAQPVGRWSDCILPEGGRAESIMGMKVQGDIKECGQGYRYQAMACYDQDNRLVETSRCNSHGRCAHPGTQRKSTQAYLIFITEQTTPLLHLFLRFLAFAYVGC